MIVFAHLLFLVGLMKAPAPVVPPAPAPVVVQQAAVAQTPPPASPPSSVVTPAAPPTTTTTTTQPQVQAPPEPGLCLVYAPASMVWPPQTQPLEMYGGSCAEADAYAAADPGFYVVQQ